MFVLDVRPVQQFARARQQPLHVFPVRTATLPRGPADSAPARHPRPVTIELHYFTDTAREVTLTVRAEDGRIAHSDRQMAVLGIGCFVWDAEDRSRGPRGELRPGAYSAMMTSGGFSATTRLDVRQPGRR
jgi:hypothetical protein